MHWFRSRIIASLLIMTLLLIWGSPVLAQPNTLQQDLERAQAQLGFTRLPPNDSSAVQPDSSYVLGPGDQCTVLIWNDKINLSYELVVNPQGQVLVPRLGVFEVEGFTLMALEQMLLQRSERVQRDRVQVRTFLRQVRRVTVLITGYVQSPGYYQLSWGTPLLDALRRAGGVRDNGSVRQVRVQRQQTAPENLDLFRFHYQGDPAANPLLKGGEHIHVPPLNQRVAVLGEVHQAGLYEILPGERVSDLLTWAGGARAAADPEGLMLWPEGLQKEGSFQLQPISVETALGNGDILYLQSRKLQGLERSIFVHGQVRQPGPMTWRSGLSLLDLMQQAGGELPSADLGNVLISRVDQGRRQQIQVDLKAYLSGQNPEGNPQLRPDDVVWVPETFWNIRNVTELTTLVLSTLGIVSVVVNLSQTR